VRRMGRPLLIWRLVIGDIKRRRVQSALLLLMIVTTTTTLTLGLALHKVTDSPFARTRAATRGPDIIAQIAPLPAASGGAASPGAAQQFAALTRARGVVGTSGPYPVALARLTARGIDTEAQAQGRDLAPAAIDQPELTAGSWLRSGGAVVERGFADALGLHVGSAIHLNGRPLRVSGIAVSTAQCFYPVSTPGVIWVTRGEAESLATPQDPLGYVLNVKLADPNSSQAFLNGSAAAAFGNAAQNDSVSLLNDWTGIEQSDFKVISVDQKVLLIASTLLAMLAIASIAVVVGGRLAEQTRRVGLLKAVGGTPALVAAVLLAENLLLALAAAVVGVAIGQLVAPLLTDPGSGLLGSAPTPALSGASVLEVALVAIVVATGATVIPAIRGARTSTIRALNDPAHPPRRRPWLIALSARLPVPLLFAVRLVARRTRRSVLTALSLAIAVTMATAALTLQHQVDVRNQQRGGAALIGNGTIGDRVTHLVFLLSAILALLAAINAIFTTWATVIDAQKATALARALGATPRQISTGLTAAQLFPGLLAACLGIPAGLLLYDVAGGHVGRVAPPVPLLLAVIPATLIAVAVLTAIPARIGARRPVSEVLRSE
jgi:ABC-type antimicrobial peptide transport system permease subunit